MCLKIIPYPIPGVFQTGPASLNAIKQGHVYLPYDAKFVFAEINADRIYWEAVEDISLDDYTLTKVGEKKWAIGVYLYTKEVGRNTGVDVKGDYKFTEGQCIRSIFLFRFLLK